MERGKGRELHLEQALGLVKPGEQWGHDFVRSLKRAPQGSTLGPLQLKTFPANSYYQVRFGECSQECQFQMSIHDGYGYLLILGGHFTLKGLSGHEDLLTKGCGALLGFKSFPISFKGSGSFVIVIPALSQLEIRGDHDRSATA